MADDIGETPNAEPHGLTVAEMAKVTGATAHTLRYYERAGLIQPITRTVGNQRRYQPGDVDWVRFLVRLRETGMPIAQMRDYAAFRSHGDSTLPARLNMMTEHHEALRLRIKRLRDHERALAATISTHQQTIDHVGGTGAGNPRRRVPQKVIAHHHKVSVGLRTCGCVCIVLDCTVAGPVGRAHRVQPLHGANSNADCDPCGRCNTGSG